MSPSANFFLFSNRFGEPIFRAVFCTKGTMKLLALPPAILGTVYFMFRP
jgi:hypothetical protein